MAAARRVSRDRYGTPERAEWEGFCLLHRLIERHSTSARRYVRRHAPPVPPGWTELPASLGCPWVMVDTGRDGKRTVRQLGDDEFAAEFEPTEQAWEGRRDALIIWARHQLASVDADYLRLNAADRDRPPWTDPVLRAERDRIAALVQESGLSYDQTFDPDWPDRTLRKPPSPASFRVTADVAAVLQVLLGQPGERLRGDVIWQRSGLGWKAARHLWRLKQAGWADDYTDEPGASDSRLWWLTETGIRLARERLDRRTKNDEQL